MPWWCIDPRCCSRHHSPAWLSFHSSFWLLFLFISKNWPSLSRTLPPYCSFYSASKGQLSHLNSPQFLLLFITCQFCSVSWDSLSHLWESVCKTLLCCTPQPLPRNIFWPKKILPTDILELGSGGCLWCPFVKANFTRKDMLRHQKLRKTPWSLFPK